MDFVRACKENASSRIQTTSPFKEAGPFNEMVVMGVLAIRLQSLNQELLWDGLNMKFTNIDQMCIRDRGLEGHRYFDLIRWGIAVQTLNQKRLHGIKIEKKGNDFAYEKVECDTQDRLFPERYTIFPIPCSELQTNILCEQNDLWK